MIRIIAVGVVANDLAANDAIREGVSGGNWFQYVDQGGPSASPNYGVNFDAKAGLRLVVYTGLVADESTASDWSSTL